LASGGEGLDLGGDNLASEVPIHELLSRKQVSALCGSPVSTPRGITALPYLHKGGGCFHADFKLMVDLPRVAAGVAISSLTTNLLATYSICCTMCFSFTVKVREFIQPAVVVFIHYWVLVGDPIIFYNSLQSST